MRLAAKDAIKPNYEKNHKYFKKKNRKEKI
jgi:hypothetical protein